MGKYTDLVRKIEETELQERCRPTMTIKPIETRYRGFRCRSRLEARWMVFFDHLGIEYHYEPEGFDLGELGYYLPDFWLPQVEMWAEVKGRPFSPDEGLKCETLAKESGYACLMLDGPPAARNYWAHERGYGAEGGPEYEDYLLYEGRRCWETAGRFYSCTGADSWQVEDYSEHFAGTDGERAINAARGARFEHGESGAA